MSIVRWGDLSDLISACLVERPDLAARVDRDHLAPGPARRLHELIQRRLSDGLAADLWTLLAAVREEELDEIGGRSWLLNLTENGHLLANFEQYLREVRRLAVDDAINRACANGGINARQLRGWADSLEASAAASAVVAFLPVDEYLATVAGSPEGLWVWRGYIARGAVSLLTGPPKRGKSTLLAALVNAIRLRTETFLGRAIATGAVVLLSEESHGTLAPKLTPGTNLSVLDRSATFPRQPWPTVVTAAGEQAARLKAALVVVDTLPWWAGLGPEAEKDAGRMQEAIEPLLQLAAAGHAVLVVHHDRKGGGDDGEAARGSTALAASVDAIINLARRNPSETPSPRRTLLALSRWGDVTPDALIYQRHPDGSLAAVAEGDRGEVSHNAIRGRVLDAIGTATLTVQDIAQALGVTRQRIGPPLAELVRTGDVEKIERARANEANRYRRSMQPPDATPSFNPLATERPSASLPLPIEGNDDGNNDTLPMQPLAPPPNPDQGAASELPVTATAADIRRVDARDEAGAR